MASLIVDEIQPATAVQDALVGSFTCPGTGHPGAEGLGQQQLLVNCGDYLQLWEPSDGTMEVQQTFHLFERIEHMALVPSSLQLFGPGNTDAVLAFTFDGRCCLFRLLPQPEPQPKPASATPAVAMPRQWILSEAACLTLPLPHMRDGLLPKRLQGVCCSSVAPLARHTPAARNGGRGVAVAAIHMGLLHVITLHGGGSGGGHDGEDEPLLLCTAVLMSDTPLYGLPPGSDPLYVMQHCSQVLALAFLPPPERGGEHEAPLLAVLHKPEGEVTVGLWLDCLALQLTLGEAGQPVATGGSGAEVAAAAAARTAVAAGLPPTGLAAGAGGDGGGQGGGELRLLAEVVKGPWAVRNLHPTTSLLAPFPGNTAAGLPPGLLAISSRSATLLTRPPPLADLATAVAAAAARADAAAAARAGPSGSRPTDPWVSGAAAAAAAAGAAADPLAAEAAAEAFLDAAFGQEALSDAAVEVAEASVRKVELVSYGMAGLPACVESLGRGVYVIGDTAAGLHLLHAGGPTPWCRQVDAGAPGLPSAASALPSMLRYLPGAAAAATAGEAEATGMEGSGPGAAGLGADGLLFVGSTCSNSQVLLVPAASVAPSAQAPSCPPHWPLAEVAAIKSLAPLMDAVVVPDSAGADDPWVVASCGYGSAGRLVRARMAAALKPCMGDGPEVPAGCRVFALRLGGCGSPDSGRPSQPHHHTHVALSSDATCWTGLLSSEADGVFSQATLPGLLHDAASLLVADVGGRRLVQVLQGSVRVLEPIASGAGLAAEWTAPGEPLVLAAQSGPGGPFFAVASRASLHLLRVSPASGSIALLHSHPLPHQLSALALARLLPCCAPAAKPPASQVASAATAEEEENLSGAVLLMGQWESNAVEVASAADPSAPLLRLSLGPDEKPRSLALLELSGGRPPVLLAGTHSGTLFMWQLTTAAAAPMAAAAAGQGAGQRGRWRAGPCHALRISRVAVELLPGAPIGVSGDSGGSGGGVYVHSSCGAIVRPRLAVASAATAAGGGGRSSQGRGGGVEEAAEGTDLAEVVEVVRVAGSEGLQALCHVSTAALGGGAAWVTGGGRLLFGRIDPRVALRWSTAYVGETITSLAYHAASHCLVALCETPEHAAAGSVAGPGAALRVIHADTLQQVLSMRLAPGHYPTAAIVAHLPCTSAPPSASSSSSSSSAAATVPSSCQATLVPSAEAASASGDSGGGGKEFVVLSSYLALDPSADPRVATHARGGQLLQGVLSFLELTAQPAADGSAATSYKLLMHGAVAIPAVASCLAVAKALPHSLGADEPSGGAGGVANRRADQVAAAAVEATAAAAALRRVALRRGGDGDVEGSAAERNGLLWYAGADASMPADAAARNQDANMPYLVAGCQDGVYLFQVHVDDGAVDGSRAVKGALELVDKLDELRLPLPKHAEALAAARAAAAATADAMSTDSGGGGARAAGQASRSGGGGEDMELAEDESGLPEVDPVARTRSHRPDGSAQDADNAMTGSDPDNGEAGEEDPEYAYGLGALGTSDGDADSGDEAEATEEDEDGSGDGEGWWRRYGAYGAGGGGGGGGAGRGGARGGPARDAAARREAAPEAGRALRSLRERMQRELLAAVNGRGGDGGSSDSDSSADLADAAGAAAGQASWGPAGGGAAAGTPLRRLLRDVERDWGTHVTLRELARAATFGRCAVTSLATLDGLVAAGDCLGSVTLLRLAAAAQREGGGGGGAKSGGGGGGGGGVSGRVALVPVSVDRHPVYAQAFLPLSPTRLLAAVHPHGLALLARDVGAEERAMREARRQAVAEFEAGIRPHRHAMAAVWEAAPHGDAARPGAARGPPPESLGLQRLRVEQLPGLDCLAACRTRHSVTRMCRMPLGLRLRRRGDGDEDRGPTATSGPGADPQPSQQRDTVLCFSSSGQVAAVRLAETSSVAAAAAQESLFAPLAALQEAVTALPPADLALLTDVDSDSYWHADSWPLVMPRETAAASGLAGVGGSIAGAGGAGGGAAGTRGEGGGGGGGAEPEVDEEEEARLLAEGCVDGALLRLVAKAAEAAVEGGEGVGGGGQRAAVLQGLAQAVVGRPDVGALLEVLERTLRVAG